MPIRTRKKGWEGFKYSFICFFGNQYPSGSPELCFILAGFLLGLSWAFIPMGVRALFEDIPFLSNELTSALPAAHWPTTLGIIGASILSYFSLVLICRGIQLCFPWTYRPFGDE